MNDFLPHQPRIHHFDTVTSVLDRARDDDMVHSLQPFDSITAKCQTTGRGQYHRQWVSPEGNVYAAMRLPLTEPFTGTQAAVALSAWLAEALNREGYPAQIKWPNDIVIIDKNTPRKVCGILLEDRANILLAGIGINVNSHPSIEMLRENTAIAAGNLADVARLLGLSQPNADRLWKTLVSHVFSFYSYRIEPSCDWLDKANTRLLWRGQRVELEDSGSLKIGVLKGIGPQGDLLLETTPGKISHFLSGSIRFCS